jgi:hypothetical protein
VAGTPSTTGDQTNIPDIGAIVTGPAGTVITGSYTYESTDPPSFSFGGESFFPLKEFHMTFPGYQVDMTSFLGDGVVLFNDFDFGAGPVDAIQGGGANPVPPQGGLSLLPFVYFGNMDPSQFSTGDSLPTSLNPALFQAGIIGTWGIEFGHCFGGNGNCDGTLNVTGFVTSASLDTGDAAAPVPEPTSMMLLGTGLTLAASRLRRRRRS